MAEDFEFTGAITLSFSTHHLLITESFSYSVGKSLFGSKSRPCEAKVPAGRSVIDPLKPFLIKIFL